MTDPFADIFKGQEGKGESGVATQDAPSSGGDPFAKIFGSEKTSGPKFQVLNQSDWKKQYESIGAAKEKGYGVSTVQDKYSGKFLLSYENPNAKASQLLEDRVSPGFDFTKPHKLDKSMLQNGRLPESASEPIKQKLGGGYSDELDHQIALELSGSNEPANLAIEPGRKGFDIMHPSTWLPSIFRTSAQALDTRENQLARDVVGGKISLLDAQMTLAKEKGHPMQEDVGKTPKTDGKGPSGFNFGIPTAHADEIPTKERLGGVSASGQSLDEKPIPFGPEALDLSNVGSTPSTMLGKGDPIRLPFGKEGQNFPEELSGEYPLNFLAQFVSRGAEGLVATALTLYKSLGEIRDIQTGESGLDVQKGNVVLEEKPMNLPFDPSRIGLPGGVQSLQKMIVDDFLARQKGEASDDFATRAKNAALTSLTVVVPHTLDALVASDLLATPALKGLLKLTRYDPALSESLAKFGLTPGNVSYDTLKTKFVRIGEELIQKGDSQGLNELGRSLQIIGERMKEGNVGFQLNKLGQAVQDMAKTLLTPFEELGTARTVAPLGDVAEGLPGYRTKGGVVRPAVGLSTEEIEPVGRESILKGQDAVNDLVSKKEGEVKNAFSNPEVGKIDLVWGTTEGEGGGLSKIIQDHPEAVDRLDSILASAKVVGSRAGRIYLETDDGFRAVVRTDFDESPKQWLLTAYKKGQGERSRTSSESFQTTHDAGSLRPADSSLSPSKEAVKIPEKGGGMTTKPPSLGELGLKEPSPFVTKRESTLLADRIKALARGSRLGAIGTRSEISKVQREVVEILKQSELSSEDKAKFLTSILRVQTPSQLRSALPEIRDRIVRLDEDATKRDLLSKIKDELGEKMFTGKGDARVSKYSPEITKKLQEFKEQLSFKNPESMREAQLEIVMKWTEEHPNEPYPEWLQEKIDELQRTHLKFLSIPELEEQLQSIETLKTQGKTYRRLKLEQTARARSEIIKQFNDDITGGMGIAEGGPIITSQKKGNFFKRWADHAKEFFYSRQLIPDNVFDILDEKTGAPIYGGKIHNKFINLISAARDARIRGTTEALAEVQSALNKLTPGQLNKTVDLGSKGLFRFKMTRNEMIDIYIASHDAANLESIIEGNKIPQEKIDLIISMLTEQEKALGDAMLNHWANSYEDINRVFRERHFFDMPKSGEGQYVPMVKDMDYVGNEDINLLKQQLEYAKASVSKGFTKMRTGSLAPIKLDVVGKYVDMVARTEHYKAFELAVQEMNAILKGIKEAVVQEHGHAYYRMLEEYLKRVANQGKYDHSYLSRSLMNLRTSVGTGVLGLNPITSIKHMLASIGGALSELGTVDFFRGVYHYFSHRREWNAFWDKVPLFAERARSITREVQEISRQTSAFSQLSGRTPMQQKLMFLLHAGDKNVVRSEATAVYLRALKQGKTEEESIAQAVSKLRRTQTGGAPEDTPALMAGGTWEKMLTMFMSERNKYLNLIYGYSRAYAKGRVSFGQFSRALFYAWIFNGLAMEEARKGGKATPKDLALAVALGPFENLLVMGSVIESVRTGYQYEATPVFGLMNDVNKYIREMVSGKHFLKGLGDLSETAATIAGIPATPVVRFGTGMHDLLTGKTNDWRRLIWSASALGEKKEKKEKLDSRGRERSGRGEGRFNRRLR